MSWANDYGLTFHHLGLAVPVAGPAGGFLRGLGYVLDAAVFDPLQNVNLIMCRHPSMPAVEIIFPGPEEGPLEPLLRRHRDGLVYHLCYAARDVAASVAAIKKSGRKLICVSAPKPAVLFDNRDVSFYMVAGFGLIEIVNDSQ